VPCFTETIESYLSRLDQIAREYSNICGIEKKVDIKALMDYSEKLSYLELYASKPYLQVPSNYTANSSFSDPNLNANLSQKTIEVLYKWQSGTNMTTTKSLEELRMLLNNTIESTSISQQYPLFFLSNILKLSEFRRQMVTLRSMSEVSKNQCLPSEWKYVTTLDYNSGTNQVVVKYYPKTFDGTCVTKQTELVINPIDLYFNGVAVSFWVKEDYTRLLGSMNNVISGVINNKLVFSYDLVKKDNYTTQHNIRIMNETKQINSNASCVENVFFMMAVQKDCDQYKLIISIRFPGSNSNVFYTLSLKASSVETMVLTYNTNNQFTEIMNQRFSRNFLYNFENEMILMYSNGYPSDIFQCKPPGPNCLYYDIYGVCKACPSPKLFFNNTCYTTCPDGYFGRDGNCVPCSSGCKKCYGENANQCNDCFSDRVPPVYLYNEQCINKCPANTWPYTLTNGTTVCWECNQYCLTCTDWKSCSSCKPPTYSFNDTCVVSCPQGTYPDEINKKCVKCATNCTTCTGEFSCGGCTVGNYLKDGKCISKCGEYYFPNNLTQSCDPCITSCRDCTDSKYCQRCNNVTNLIKFPFGDKCDPKCPPGTTSINNVCISCSDTNCIRCTQPNTCDECIKSANSTFFLKDGKCVSNCGDFYYANAKNGTCNPCADPNCQICEEGKCNACKPEKVLVDNKYCPDFCPNGYVRVGKECVKCTYPDQCKSCLTSDYSKCDVCYDGKFLYEGSCVDKCPIGFFVENGKCSPCPEGCAYCTDSLSCVDCKTDYLAMIAKGGKCVKTCPEGWAPTNINGTNICVSCTDNVNCALCNSANPSNCEKCKSTSNLYNFRCYTPCPPSTFKTLNNTCESCKTNCLNCTNALTCNRCDSTTFLQNDQCVKNCTDGSIPINGVCINCNNTSCKKCLETNLNMCVECPIGTYLYNNTCVQTCPKSTYKDGLKCYDCVSPCTECVSAKNCTNCIKNFSLTVNNTCTDTCDNGYASVNGKCTKCIDVGCSKCNASVIDECINCDAPYKLFNGDCVQNCPDYFTNINNVCDRCSASGCTKCNNKTECINCESGKYLLENKQCVNPCPLGYVDNIINNVNQCVSCNKKCETCRKDNTNYCLSCPQPLALYNGDCVSTCPSGYYKSFVNNTNYICQKCNVDQCSSCNDYGDTCSACGDNFLWQDNKCVSSCSDGYALMTTNNTCLKCLVPNCKTCPIANLKICQVCTYPYFKNKDNDCVRDCPISTFGNNTNRNCESCIPNCKSCDNGYTCKECDIGYYKFNETCVKDCPSGYYKSNGFCISCFDSKNCSRCDADDPKKCYECNAPTKLLETTCVGDCPKGYFDNKNGSCIRCSSDCQVCTDIKTCDLCVPPKVLDVDRVCKDKCPDKFVEKDGKCIACTGDTNCAKCNQNNTAICEYCVAPLLVHNNRTCVNECPQGFYPQGTKCVECRANCQKCTNSTTCDECFTGYYLYDNFCVNKCADGFVGLNKKCYNCPEKCVSCETPDKCLTCSTGYLLENGRCVDKCSIGYFSDETNKYCSPCSDGCLKCKSKDSCDTCNSTLVNLNGRCVPSCGKGYVVINQKCESCSVNCDECNPSNKEICKQCQDGYFLYNDQCKTDCPATTYKNNKTCINCISGCDVCNDTVSCTNCTYPNTLSFDGKSCLQYCPDGQTPINRKCTPCDVGNCKTCNTKISTCEVCKSPKFLHNNTCIDFCPRGTYLKDNICYNCDPICADCISQDTCKACKTGSVLMNGKCISNCPVGFVEVNSTCVSCNVTSCGVCTPDPKVCNQCVTPKVLMVNNTCTDFCPERFYQLDRNCKNCSEYCRTCTDAKTCTKCDDGFVLQNGVCQKLCNEGYAPVNGICKNCTQTTCKTCTSQNLDKCDFCFPGYYLKNGICVTDCDDRYYQYTVSQGNVICLSCSDNCLKCLSNNTCQSCVAPTKLQDNKCVQDCSPGYVSTLNNTCIQCGDPKCLTCDSNNNQVCKQCINGHYLLEGQCVNGCPAGYYANSVGTCVKCSETNCKVCSSPLGVCQNCTSPYLLDSNNKCVSKCPDGYSAAPEGVCKPCIVTDCAQCTSDQKLCESCVYPKSLNDNSCVPNCPKGKVAKNGKCVSCIPNCNECLDTTTCNNCTSPFLLNDAKQCVDNCTKGSVEVNGTCKNCTDPYCDVCAQDTTTCKKCTTGLYLAKNGTCVRNCSSGTFTDTLSGKCSDCYTTCATCSGYPNPCTSCLSPNVLYKDECVSRCPDGYVDIKGVCTKCSSDKCKSCNPSNLTECYDCKSPYLKDENNCVSTCPTNKLPTNNTCVVCKENCSVCHVDKTCDVCQTGLFKYVGNCVSSCPNGTYTDYDSCRNCTNSKCKTCESGLIKCTSCYPGQYLYNGNCYDECPVSTFLGLNNTCYDCSISCTKCTAQNNCTECVSGFGIIKRDNGIFCDKEPVCPSGYTVTKEGNCIPCVDSNCQSCYSASPSQCNTCKQDYFLFGTSCVKPCPQGFYGIQGKCYSCDTNCKNCTSKGSCSECFDRYYLLSNSTCVDCNNPRYVKVGKYCQPCNVDNCLQCDLSNPDICLNCRYPFALSFGKCTEECPAGYYKDGMNCKQCSSTCETCSDPNSCKTCKAGTYLLIDKCVDKCPTGWVVTLDRKCVKCTDDNCVLCNADTPDVCNQCNQYTFLFQGKCKKVCDDGYFAKDQTCNRCPENCTRCDGPNSCAACNNGYKVQDGKCVGNCTVGYYYDQITNNCFKCDDLNCLACSPQNVCKDCKPPTVLNKITDQCVYRCPRKYFINKENNTCELCSSECALCNNKNTCTACNEGYYWYNNTCISACPDKYTIVNGNCVPCSSSDCLACKNGDPDFCNKCDGNLYTFNGKCYQTCPASTTPMILSNSTAACINCNQKCASCNSTACTECKQGFRMINGTCINMCPDGSTPLNGICAKCSVLNCATCESDLIRCIDCLPGFFNQNGECVPKCDDGYFQKGNVCRRCSEYCKKCSDENSCIECQNNLHEGKCVDRCPQKYYPLCGTGVTRCEKCATGCRYCENNLFCKECDDGYIRMKDYCILPQDCPGGRFVDIKNKICNKCRIPFCQNCTDSSYCTICKNGYLLQNNVCTENKNFTNIINSAYLFDEYTYNYLNDKKSININKDISGVGIGSTEFAISLWARLITPLQNLQETRVFEIRVPLVDTNTTTYNYTSKNTFKLSFGFSRTTIGSPVCSVSLNTPNGDRTVKVQGQDCSFKNIYNWKLFIVQFKKSNNNYGKIMMKTVDETTNTILPFMDNIPFDYNFDLLSRDSFIYFNEDASKNPIYELSNMNIMDFLPNDNDILKLFSSKPSNCDYMCSNCQGTCRTCSNGAILTNGKCPAGFISIFKDPIPISTPFNTTLRKFNLNKPVSSDTYNFVAMIYFDSKTNLTVNSLQLFNMYYQTSSSSLNIFDLNLIDGFMNIKLTDMILPLTLTQKNGALRSGQWYSINLSFTPGSIKLQLVEWGNDIIINQQISNTTQVIRITDDVGMSISYNPTIVSQLSPFVGTVADIRLYLNNVIESQEFVKYISGLNCDPNCMNCNNQLTCLKCKDNFVINKAGNCDSLGLTKGIQLLNKLNVYNNRVSNFVLSNSDEYSFFVWYRKKIHSFVPSNPEVTLISLNNKPLLTENLLSNYISNYTMRSPFDISSKSAPADNSDTTFDWYQFIFIKTGNTFSIRVLDIKNNSLELLNLPFNNTDQTVSLSIGDQNGEQINTEFALLTSFNTSIKDISRYRDIPVDCDPSCISCNYLNGICNVCKTDSTSGKTCPQNVLLLKRSIIQNVQDYNKTLSALGSFNPSYNLRLSDSFQTDVNSMTYSVTTWFSLFTRNMNNVTNGSVVPLFRLSNNDNVDKYSTVYTPSRSLIKLSIQYSNLTNTLIPSYYFLVSQLNKTLFVKVDGLEVRESEFIYIHAGIDVANKNFSYTIFSPVDGKEYTKSIKLTNYPEKLQEVGTLKLFGVNSIKGNRSVIPNGFFYNTMVSVNTGYNSTLVNLTKTSNNPYTDTTPCDSNCNRCFAGICLECQQGYNLDSSACIKKPTLNYIILTDQNYVSENDGSGNSINSYSIKVPSTTVSANHGFQVFLRRNYIPFIYGSTYTNLSTRKIMNYGLLDIYLIATSQSQANIRIDNQLLPTSSISLGPIDIDVNKDFDWYALILFVDYTNSNLIATIQSSNGARVDQKTTPYRQFSFDTISFNTLTNEVSLVGATLVTDVPSLQNSIFEFPLLECPVDCSQCVQNTCKACDYGLTALTNSCIKKAIRPYNILIQSETNLPNSLSLYDYLRYSKNPRFRDFSIIFTVQSSNSLPNIGNIFKIINNNDVSLAKFDPYSINYNVMTLERTDLNTYVLYYTTRSEMEKNRTPTTEKINNLPSPIVSETTTIGISVDHNAKNINIFIYNTEGNTVSQTIPLKGIFDNFGTYTNIVFGNNFKSKAEPVNPKLSLNVKDITFYYEQPMNLSDLQKNVREISRKIQQPVCSNFGASGCVSCFDGKYPAIKGICVPAGVTSSPDISKIPQFFLFPYQIQQSLVSGDLVPSMIGTYSTRITSLNFGFQYRRISYPESDYIGILSLGMIIPGSPFNPLLSFYERTNSLFMSNNFNSNGQLLGEIENIYTQSSRFGWLSINVDCNLITQICNLSIYNYATDSSILKTFSSSAVLPTNLYTPPAGANFAIIYDLTSIPLKISDTVQGIPGRNSEWEISNIMFVPNYQYLASDLPSLRLPLPKKCDKLCLCGCADGVCPTNCRVKNNVISIQDQATTSTTSTTTPKNLFRALSQYIIDKSYVFTPEQRLDTILMNNFIANVQVNMKSYFLSLQQTTSTQTLSPQSSSSSGLSSISLVRFKEEQVSLSNTSTSTSSLSSSSNTISSSSLSSSSLSSSSLSSTSTSSGLTTSSSTSNLFTKANSDILLIVTNQAFEAVSLSQGQVIPQSITDYSILTVKVKDLYTLRFIMGSSVQNKFVSYKDVSINNSLQNITKLNIIVYSDIRKNMAKIIIYADDKRFDVSFNYNYSTEPLNRSSMIYTHSSITSSNIIVSLVRLDYALTYLLQDKTVYSNFCDRSTCNQCYSDPTGDSCLVCNASFALYNGTCRPRQFTIPIANKKKRTTVLKGRSQRVLKN